MTSTFSCDIAYSDSPSGSQGLGCDSQSHSKARILPLA